MDKNLPMRSSAASLILLIVECKPWNKDVLWQRGKQTNEPNKNSDQPETNTILTASNFVLLTIFGRAGLIFILWLILFKPF